MSGIHLSGNRLTQRIQDREEELGHIELEPSSDKCVLWLKDTFGIASTAGAYIRAEEYPSLDAAKSNVLSAPSLFIWHLVWIRNVLQREAEKELDQKWEELISDTDNFPKKQSIRDKLRAHLDRLSGDKIVTLFGKIGTVALTQVITEVVKKYFEDE